MVVVLLAGALALAAGCSGGGAESRSGAASEPGSEVAPLSLVETLGGLDTAGYARALEVRDFVFPEDHGPHEGFRTEWWYVTGNLTSSDGRPFGFQFTIFRSALAPEAPGGPSGWATNQAYMGHFALTDVDGEDFRSTERFARGGGGLAGAGNDPFRVWLEDWTLASVGEGRASAAATVDDPASVVFPLRLYADGDGAELELVLRAGKPHVLQGDRGLSQKGTEPGNASYYYAHTRLPAAGHVVLDGDTLRVEGLAWLDREWSTSALSQGQVGWDWFALQLDDGWDLMVYQLRREDGTADPLSDGVLIDPSGRRVPLVWGRDVEVEVTDRWASAVDASVYPAGWRIRVPERGWDLRVQPAVRDQELQGAFRYWEGSVRVDGSGEGGVPVEGRGYVELTGYAGSGG